MSKKDEPTTAAEELSEDIAALQNEEQEKQEEAAAEPDATAELEQRIDELEEEVAQLKDAQLRKTAEMDNMRKRTQRDRAQLFSAAKIEAVNEFLTVNDDLHRTLLSMKEGGANDSYIDGVQAVADKFDQVLERYGVERIDETGVPFDVELHDALLRQKAEDESVESDTVLTILENGYRMGDKTIRHAKVVVSE
ncbi:MAG: nucleotide exchange factor GrpE [Balneolaceae bacterium]